MELGAAFLLGLGGSLHCAGMCGPLVLAASGRGTHRLLYHGGRLLTYASLGALSGSFGAALLWAGWQQGLSILLGSLVIAGSAAHLLRRRVPLAGLPARLAGWIRSTMARALPSRHPLSRLVVGAVNGLLPCGLVYVALAAAAATGGWRYGALAMLLFGAGTVPLLLLGSWVGGHLSAAALQTLTQRVVPLGTLALGALLVLRGLGLGIPYVSPELQAGGHAHMH